METNKASSTALTVLQGLVYTAKFTKFNFLVSDEVLKLSEKILSSFEEGRKRLKIIESSLFRSTIVSFANKFLMRGMTVHYALRKKFIEEKTLKEIEENKITQIINLGGGFDTLLLRTSKKYENLRFIEIDHPATQKDKLKALENSKIDISRNLEFLSVDFEKERMKEKLKIDPNQNTLFIIEGVLMYLSEGSILELLKEILEVSNNKASILFTFAEINPCKLNLLNLYLKLKNENLKFETSRENLKKMFEKSGFKIELFADEKFFKESFLPTKTDDKKLIQSAILNQTEIISFAIPV